MDQPVESSDLDARLPETRTIRAAATVPAPYDAAPSGAFRMAFVFFCLVLVLAGPFLVGKFQYHATYNSLKAEVDVAGEALSELRPRLNDFVLASRLVAKRVSPCVVSIYRAGSGGLSGQGSGVIIDSDGHIVTNNHVVEFTPRLRVRLSDGRERNAVVVGRDAATDLAVLKIDLPNLIAAEWGSSDELEVGDLVWAVGSPFGLDRSITFGIISAKGRGTFGSPYKEYLQTDAAVNPGNSGGPLVDMEGKVVGINTAIVGDGYQGVSFAIPSRVAIEQYKELIDKGWIERGYLGIRPVEVPAVVRSQFALPQDEGVYVEHVNRGDPADVSGIRPGDVILQWNDHVATNPMLLSRTIAATEIGSTAHVVVARKKQRAEESSTTVNRLEFDVIVGKHPSY